MLGTYKIDTPAKVALFQSIKTLQARLASDARPTPAMYDAGRDAAVLADLAGDVIIEADARLEAARELGREELAGRVAAENQGRQYQSRIRQLEIAWDQAKAKADDWESKCRTMDAAFNERADQVTRLERETRDAKYRAAMLQEDLERLGATYDQLRQRWTLPTPAPCPAAAVLLATAKDTADAAQVQIAELTSELDTARAEAAKLRDQVETLTTAIAFQERVSLDNGKAYGDAIARADAAEQDRDQLRGQIRELAKLAHHLSGGI